MSYHPMWHATGPNAEQLMNFRLELLALIASRKGNRTYMRKETK